MARGISRRHVVGGAAAGVAFVPLGRLRAQPARKPKFFNAKELALLDELTEIIIPTDEHSPGARAAEVAWDIDRRLSERRPSIPEHAAMRARWRAGLKRIEQLCREMHKVAFMSASPEQRVSVVERIAANEAKPTKPEEAFFVELKTLTAASYYTSEIGIQKDIGYKGNAFFEEFVGYDAKTGKSETAKSETSPAPSAPPGAKTGG